MKNFSKVVYKQAGFADTGTNLREMPVQFNE